MNAMSRSEAGRKGRQASLETQKKAFEERVSNYNKDPKRCGHCQSPLAYDQRFGKYCSHSCAGLKNNPGRVSNLVDGRFSKKACAYCGKETTNILYCSHECQGNHKWLVTCEKIEEAQSLLPIASGYGYNPTVAKRYLTQTRGNKCVICGNEEWLGRPIPLVLDHVNGNPEDHSLGNVRLVCGNCNMQLPTFAGRNRGNGRKNRGKSLLSENLGSTPRGSF